MKKIDLMLDALKKLIPQIKKDGATPIQNVEDTRFISIKSFFDTHYPEFSNQVKSIAEVEKYHEIIISSSEQHLGYLQGKLPTCNEEVYKDLLPYTRLLYEVEKNGLPEEHAYKLAALFNDTSKALEYIKKFCRDIDTSQPLHDACIFALPQGEINLNVWKKLSDKYLDVKTFRDLILPQSSEIETLIKNCAQNMKPPTKEAIKKVTDEIKALNSTVKKSQSKHGRLNAEEKIEHENNLKRLLDKQMELTNLGVPFDDSLTDTALNAFRERYKAESSAAYKTFLDNGLTKSDYEKFIKLNLSVNNNETIPDVLIDGAEINQPGLYLRKIPRGDETYAALGACLGKKTGCCQSLSGEAGEPCAIHGLTSPYGGFYIVCKGDAKNPKVTDPVEGQCWAWRSQSEAIVFDSVEKSNINTRDALILFYRHLGKKLVLDGKTHAVMCGTTSGISNSVGIATTFNERENWKDYSLYSDSKIQKTIYDSQNPYYFYSDDEDCKYKTDQALDEIFKNNQPLIDNTVLVKIINWCLLSNTLPSNDLQKTIRHLGVNYNREAETTELTAFIQSFVKANDVTDSFIEKLKLYKSLIKLKNMRRNTPLILYIEKSKNIDIETINYLITNGANVNDKDLRDTSALTLSAEDDKIEVLKLLIDNGADMEMKDKNGYTALHWAVQMGQLEAIKSLIQKGANINAIDNMGYAPLHWAAQSGQTELLKLLIEKGAHVNQKVLRGSSSLHMASIFEKTESLKFLIENGANINEQDTNGNIILIEAVKRGQIELIHYLIEKGADINAKDALGNTALHEAGRFRALKTFDLLIKNGANIHIANHDEKTPLDYIISTLKSMVHDPIEHTLELLNIIPTINEKIKAGEAAIGLYQAADRTKGIPELQRWVSLLKEEFISSPTNSPKTYTPMSGLSAKNKSKVKSDDDKNIDRNSKKKQPGA